MDEAKSIRLKCPISLTMIAQYLRGPTNLWQYRKISSSCVFPLWDSGFMTSAGQLAWWIVNASGLSGNKYNCVAQSQKDISIKSRGGSLKNETLYLFEHSQQTLSSFSHLIKPKYCNKASDIACFLTPAKFTTLRSTLLLDKLKNMRLH